MIGIMRALRSLATAVGLIPTITSEVHNLILYPVAKDMGTAEIADDGTSPALTGAVSQSNKTEGEGEGTPAWLEIIDLEQVGTTTIISMFLEFHWQQQFTVGGGAGTITSAKIQISGDGGGSWVDVTDNVTENNVAYQDKTRIGIGVHIPTIAAGVNRLQLRLCAWTDDGGGVSTVETKMRSDTFMRISYRKS